jgi:hypothetical protein
MSMTQLSPEDRSMSETATIPAKNWWSRFMQRLTDLAGCGRTGREHENYLA